MAPKITVLLESFLETCHWGELLHGNVEWRGEKEDKIAIINLTILYSLFNYFICIIKSKHYNEKEP